LFPIHFTFETFRERNKNGPRGCLYGLGTGIGFQAASSNIIILQYLWSIFLKNYPNIILIV
jgi:hypothetical protein